ncbi:conserved exported hypothetical protein [Candidatus Nitrotoga sp. BS]|uniref:DUF2490 domain-containing protein n=1 Tax=Candidatus Nitrotoga sp. BS TaxID=2890408 RepID=UPI001EF3657A|nr:DUF2490 domain-containing protein [Candidatus Nitrotoga sp. BS]CAH1195783.1 conserved exported hypothetical protein [Candidatus Nitrotoga sp. BS]
MLTKINTLLALTISSLFVSGPVNAAKDINDTQTWGTATATGSLASFHPALTNFKYWAEIQGRFGDDTSRFSQAIIRSGIGYALNNTTSAWVGYAFVPTAAPFSKITFNERRVWQQLLWNDKLSFGTASSRSRLEERLVPRLGDDTALRFRQMFKISVPLIAAPSYSIVASDEYFLNLNNVDWGPRKGFDQNRAFIGVGYNLSSKIKTEIGYMNQYINRPLTSINRNDHILSINFYFNN